VIDPWTDKAAVVTGSHNFSASASKSNDENFVVIRGNPALAEAYAVNCLAVYDHYRWRKYIADCAAQHRKPWSHLSSDADWLARYGASPARRAMLKYWLP
jgi:phosphatidylserine/phosphatidylglycerophosphate/cardiolipin synthase-like enzyme